MTRYYIWASAPFLLALLVWSQDKVLDKVLDHWYGRRR